MALELIKPDWPTPPNIHGFTTTRLGGISEMPFASLNLGHHVGDDPKAVEKNRQLLIEKAKLPNEPLWLEQVHGNQIVNAEDSLKDCTADGIYTRDSNKVCAIMTADCLPLLLTNKDGSEVMALHVGWKGLSLGIVEKGVQKMLSKDILAWMGPAIGPESFEVGAEVKKIFLEQDDSADSAFKPSPQGRWLADIYLLTKKRLEKAGVSAIFGGNFDTYAQIDRFFSYRREGKTGRMATLIWMT